MNQYSEVCVSFQLSHCGEHGLLVAIKKLCNNGYQSKFPESQMQLENKFNERFSKAINHLPGNKYVMEICLWKLNGKPHVRFLSKDFSCFPGVLLENIIANLNNYHEPKTW